MYGQGYFTPQFRQSLQKYKPPAQQDRPPYPSTGFQTSSSTTTSQSYMVHQGYSSVTAHLCQPDSSIYSHLSPFPVPPSGTPNSGHSYSIPPPQLHLNGNTQLMQSFPSAQQDPQWTHNVYQIPSHFPQPSSLSPGQAPFRGLVWPTFPVGMQGTQPTLQPQLPLSSCIMNAHAFGSVAYAAPQVFHMPSALVPSLPPPPPLVPPLGKPHACVMSSATLLPSSSQINQFWYDPSSRPSLLNSMKNTGVSHLNTDSDINMEDDITHINEEQAISEKLPEPQLPTLQIQNYSARTDSVFVHVDEPADKSSLMSSYNSNSVDREQSVHVYMHNDESNTAAADVENKSVERNEMSKRSKSLKRFKVALVKFVKKVLDSSWRRCDMSSFIYKMIVKKTVDKVIGSLKHHHIPKSQEKINRYIESSRSKLTSLVMAYVDKYVTGYNVAKN